MTITPRVLAIDPGCTHTAFVCYFDGSVVAHGKEPNAVILKSMRADWYGSDLAIESIASYGMAVGAEVFETCVWSGRFIEAWDVAGRNHTRVYRKEVKLHLCGSVRAKDANVRQAIIDRYGGKDAAIGRKKTPGPLFGITADRWAALAVAITWADTRGKE